MPRKRQRGGVVSPGKQKGVFMPRSPLTKSVNRVKDVMAQYATLSEDEQAYFLDLLLPEPEETKTKIASVPTVKKRNVKRCDACNWTKRAAVHKDPAEPGYHEFQSGGDGVAKKDKSDLPVRADRCSKCGDAPESLIHDESAGYGDYHEFKSAA